MTCQTHLSVIEQTAVECSASEATVAAKGRVEDRRIQRTRQLLQGALLSLIQEKGFESLSVQDIIDRANVGRATFYAHFQNKEDLLASGIDGLRASLKERQRQRCHTRAAMTSDCLGSAMSSFSTQINIVICLARWSASGAARSSNS